MLIVCGLPGVGKSTYATHLEREGWARYSVDHPHLADPALADAWSRAFNGDIDSVLTFARQHRGVVIEWGFDPIDLPHLEALIAGGIRAWYFDGDRAAAYEGWQEEHPDDPADVWSDQVERLDRAAHRIRDVFAGRVISTVGPGRVYKSLAEIDEKLGVLE